MNSEEIAKLANVSRSTVSRVVNNYKNVPEETRVKVQKVIDQYEYTPNSSARTLAGKANNIIGLFIADIDNTGSSNQWLGANSPYNAELIAKVIQSCKRKGYMVLVNTISEKEELKKMEAFFNNRMLFGGIFIGFPYGMKEIESIAEQNYNIVFIDQFDEDSKQYNMVKTVNCHNLNGGYSAVKYLIELGHTKIAHVTGDNRLSSIEREEGYKKALKEMKIPVDSSLIINGEYREEIAYKKTKKLISDYKPTAIFSANDIMALGIIKAINEMGMSVPEDISVIGYDHLKYSEWMQLDLTTLEVSLDELSEKAVKLLFNKKSNSREICQPVLVKKYSTTKLKK